MEVGVRDRGWHEVDVGLDLLEVCETAGAAQATRPSRSLFELRNCERGFAPADGEDVLWLWLPRYSW